MWHYEFGPAMMGVADQARRSSDVILCMDERTGIPAALMAGPPVVTGIGWLERRRDLGRTQRLLAHRALHRSAAVFTQCVAMVPTLVEEFGLDERRVHSVRLGIDAEHFSPAPWPETDIPVVFSVGDDRMRDHDTLIRAMDHLVGTGTPATLVLATTSAAQVPEHVGVVQRRRMDHEVRGAYAGATVAAVALKPTRQGSGLTVALEAMASGRPLVITDNPGIDRYVEHGVTGLLVPPYDHVRFASAVRSLLDDPDRAQEMGRTARQRVEAQFTSTHMAHDLHQVLTEAVGSSALNS